MNYQVGDLVVNYSDDIGIISLIQYCGDTNGGPHLYHIRWISGGLQGYTTAHTRYTIGDWKKKLKENT